MKIVYVSHWRFPSEKTMSPLIMKTCEMLSRGGADVELWIPRRWNHAFKGVSPFQYHAVKEVFRIRRLPCMDFMGIFSGTLPFIVMVASFNISVFVMALFYTRRDTIFYLHDVRNAVPLVFFREGIFLEIHDFYKSSVDALNRLVFTRVRGLIVTNKVKMDVLRSRYGIPESGMIHAPNAVDIALFSPRLSKEEARNTLRISHSEKIVLYTGHLFYWKGVDTLFETHPLLKDGEFLYFVGGTDDDIATFKDKAKGCPNVRIVGRRPHVEIPLWLQAADVLVLPNTARFEESKYETSPVKLFEYLASGKPIVASDIPSIRDIVDDRMVWFFEADNPSSLVKVVHTALHERKKSEEKGGVAHAEAQKFSWSRRTGRVLEFMRPFIE